MAKQPFFVVKEYLEERAKTDPLFAASYAKENKNLDECWDYIVEEARKRAINQMCCMTSEEVFGLAVHYYDEDNIEIPKRRGKAKASVKTGTISTNAEKKTASKKEAKAPSKKPKQKAQPKASAEAPAKKKIVQLELFNWDEL